MLTGTGGTGNGGGSGGSNNSYNPYDSRAGYGGHTGTGASMVIYASGNLTVASGGEISTAGRSGQTQWNFKTFCWRRWKRSGFGN